MSVKQSDTQLQGITDLCLIATVKPGFVSAFETITHVERLRRVLKTLNSLRQAAREISDPPDPSLAFTDVVSRFRIVHSFRWAIIDPKPDAAGSNEPARFLLNVCFDGGWEPYMRVIWDELGSMLDLMLCHCEGYPLARENSFERYIEWVRAHEIAADFLYLDSGRSSSDHEYLALLEQSQRLHPGGDAALAASRIASPRAGATRPLPAAPRQRYQLAIRGLPALAALYALDRYFLPQAPDGACLLRASRDILFELVELDTAALFPAGDPLRQAHHRMLEWFEHKPVPVTPTPRALTFEPADIQGGMLSGYPDLSGGAMLLLRVVNRAQAVAWLSAFPATREGAAAPADGLYRNIALSLSGLRALGLSDARLARFPQAFREGMEQRASVLGDVRHNHPRYWRLPERNWPPGAQATGRRVDLNSVHVLVQLRHGKAVTPEARQQAIARLEQDSGLQLLSVQPLRRNSNAQGGTQEHFGFLDGISQPAVGAAPGRDWSDAVPRGELLLGYPTSREACAVPEVPDALLDRGTFLVVRKLRQHVGRLHTLLDAQSQALGLPRERLLAKMMGRQLDGKPLAAPAAGAAGAGHNDFNYAADPQGSMCPFHAHVRRANPRDPHDKMPRILRRGMSYGPAYDPQHPDDEDRGLVFMAYNASLSEQFETLQRWLAGGNSSGGYSGQPDPFMGVATRGEPRIYRFEDAGRAVHLNLGDQPFVELQWGAYFFVPSIAALRNLPALLELPLPAAMPAPPQAPPLDDAAAWQQWLEDGTTRDAAWAWVRAQPGGVLRCAYGVLVGDSARVMEVLRDPAERYSVSGYGERMQRSVGIGFLGMDDDGGHRQQAPLVNAAIERIGEEEAFAAAYAGATQVLGRIRALSRGLGQPEALIDLEQLSEHVLAGLCAHWFGLPDGKLMWGTEFHPPGDAPAPRCPAGFFAVARYVFGPHPSPVVERVGAEQGQALLQAVRCWLASRPALPKLTQDIVNALTPLAAGDPEMIPRTLTGIILGFPPTVHGNLVACLAAWAVGRKLWDLQQDWPLPPTSTAPAAPPYKQALSVLRPALIATMLGRPVPPMVWRRARSAHRLGGVEIGRGDTIVVGLVSATQQNPGDHYAVFGGDRRDPVQPAPLHACPGYAMAMGVMLGVAAALLEAGTLRATPSPTVLALQL